jgi:hypothetical protein
VHLASPLGLRNDEHFRAAYWKAFEDYFGEKNAPVIKAMLVAQHTKVDTGTGEIDRVCFGLRQTMAWLAEAIERKALESVGESASRERRPAAHTKGTAKGRKAP